MFVTSAHVEDARNRISIQVRSTCIAVVALTLVCLIVEIVTQILSQHDFFGKLRKSIIYQTAFLFISIGTAAILIRSVVISYDEYTIMYLGKHGNKKTCNYSYLSTLQLLTACCISHLFAVLLALMDVMTMLIKNRKKRETVMMDDLGIISEMNTPHRTNHTVLFTAQDERMNMV
ncbi:hypothetical protein SNEBB_006094 [Seison nebaliae]|nr:hypothetical protein SNEBB_006094 [Seison nebaliae]